MSDIADGAGPGEVVVARVYDERGSDPAVHALVDRLWPRGVRKEDPRIDEWWKVLAPSADLRTWYGHEPDRFEEFSARYVDELEAAERAEDLDRARTLAREQGLVLLTATKDLSLAHTSVLASVIEAKIDQSPR